MRCPAPADPCPARPEGSLQEALPMALRARSRASPPVLRRGLPGRVSGRIGWTHPSPQLVCSADRNSWQITQELEQQLVELFRAVERRQMAGAFDDAEFGSWNQLRDLPAYHRREQPVELTGDHEARGVDALQSCAALEFLRSARDVGERAAWDLAVDALPARQKRFRGRACPVALVEHL